MKNTNLVRIGKVSFFDLAVSRKSPHLWHFFAVFPAVTAGALSKTRRDVSSIAVATVQDSATLAGS
jgi:hypothetical protein